MVAYSYLSKNTVSFSKKNPFTSMLLPRMKLPTYISIISSFDHEVSIHEYCFEHIDDGAWETLYLKDLFRVGYRWHI